MLNSPARRVKVILLPDNSRHLPSQTTVLYRSLMAEWKRNCYNASVYCPLSATRGVLYFVSKYVMPEQTFVMHSVYSFSVNNRQKCGLKSTCVVYVSIQYFFPCSGVYMATMNVTLERLDTGSLFWSLSQIPFLWRDHFMSTYFLTLQPRALPV